ncbi:hypothetical protein ACHAWF_009197 [Thalassiosira exigua]
MKGLEILSALSLFRVLCCCLISRGVLSRTFNSLISHAKLINADQSVSLMGNVNFVEDGNNNLIPICFMPYMQPFSSSDGSHYNELGEYEGLATVALAMEHLNTGNGTIVPDLQDIHQRCPLRFTTKSFDTRLQPTVGVNHVIKLTDRNKINLEEGKAQSKLFPCAILGAHFSSVSMPTSMISGLRGVPQISPLSTSPRLDDQANYPLFGRTIPNDEGMAIPLLKLLESWDVKYLAVLHIDDPYGNAFSEGIRHAAKRLGIKLQVKTIELAVNANDAEISRAVQKLSKTLFTYFFGVLYPIELVDRVMTEAYHQEVAGTGRHNWLFVYSAGSVTTDTSFSVGTPLEKAFKGVGLFGVSAGSPGMIAYDKLTNSMQRLKESEEDMSFLESLLPENEAEKYVNYSIPIRKPAYLESLGLAGAFAYDSVVALGIAACGLLASSPENLTIEHFTGEELFRAFVENTPFEGTSGLVTIEDTGSRDPQSVTYLVTNFIDDSSADVEPGKVAFKGVKHLFTAGEWAESIVSSYTFNDGTVDSPSDTTLQTNSNYLSTWVRVIGLLMCAIIATLDLYFAIWTHANSTKRVVRSSQPIFLLIICMGTLLMGE